MSTLSINTNLSSLKSQRRLTEATAQLSKSYQRLSSGLRINRAADDAAGLAIACALDNDSKIFSQAVRNINDSVSFLSVTEAAASELKNIIIRSEELAQQAANGTLSDRQRTALDTEMQQLGQEYNRILESTSFNTSLTFSRSSNGLVTQAGMSTLSTSADCSRAQSVDALARENLGLNGEANSDSHTSMNPSISADGRYAVFESNASNLVAGDNNGVSDIFLKDMQTGTLTRVSTTATGSESNGVSNGASISSDGRYVVFSSWATNLVTGDNNNRRDIFVKDILTGSITRATVSATNVEGNNSSDLGSISADGRYVSFQSDATNLITGDSNAKTDIFVKDLQTGSVVRASSTSSWGQGSSFSYNSCISANGRYVVFQSFASDLIAGDGNGQPDIFVKDLQTGTTTRVSTTAANGEANSGSYMSSISDDGRYVVFESNATNLTGSADNNGATDIFRKDLQTGEIIRVSTTGTGTEADSGSYAPALSANGRFVAFYSDATNLVNGDGNSLADLFIKDLQTGTVRRLSISASGREATSSYNNEGSRNPSISADGRYVFFQSDMRDLLDGPPTGDIYSVYGTANTLIDGSQLTRFQWVNIRTQSEAKLALPWLKKYMDEVNSFEGSIGASLSRLDTAKNNLFSAHENYQGARSRITDADVAEESAALMRDQILQQAASAVLAQANQVPALALTLLKG